MASGRLPCCMRTGRTSANHMSKAPPTSIPRGCKSHCEDLPQGRAERELDRPIKMRTSACPTREGDFRAQSRRGEDPAAALCRNGPQIRSATTSRRHRGDMDGRANPRPRPRKRHGLNGVYEPRVLHGLRMASIAGQRGGPIKVRVIRAKRMTVDLSRVRPPCMASATPARTSGNIPAAMRSIPHFALVCRSRRSIPIPPRPLHRAVLRASWVIA